MPTESKPLLDSNILIYAANVDSSFYEKAVEVIEIRLKRLSPEIKEISGNLILSKPLTLLW